MALLLLTATLLYHAPYGYLPGGGQYRGWEEVTPHHRRAEIIFEQIPPAAKLSAHDRLNPHVSQRETLYIFDRIEDADHIVLDATEDSWPLHPVELRHRVDDFLATDFGVVDALDGYILLAKDRPGLPRTLPDPFYDFARIEPADFAPQYATNIQFGDKLRLLGYDLGLGAHEAFLPTVTLYWQALAPLERDYRLWPFFIDQEGRPIADPDRLPLVATIWYPTSAWSPEEIIAVRTLPHDLGEQFTLAVGVADGDWSDSAQRLPISQVDADFYTFEQETWVRLNTFQRVGRKTYEAVAPESIPMQPYEVQFWDLIDLQAAAVQPRATAGESLPLTLAWRARAPLTVDLTTFAHLLNQEGQAVAQLDWGPQDGLGYLPTTAWQPDRLVVDQQRLPLPDDLPPGDYRLVVGWYYAVTGDRLPLTEGGEGDALPVGVVRVE